jgi:hypothetical protein
MTGEAVTEQTSKTLQEWARRPKIVVTLSSDDEPIAPPTMKRRKLPHQADFDFESSIDSASDDFDAPHIVTTLQRRQLEKLKSVSPVRRPQLFAPNDQARAAQGREPDSCHAHFSTPSRHPGPHSSTAVS